MMGTSRAALRLLRKGKLYKAFRLSLLMLYAWLILYNSLYGVLSSLIISTCLYKRPGPVTYQVQQFYGVELLDPHNQIGLGIYRLWVGGHTVKEFQIKDDPKGKPLGHVPSPKVYTYERNDSYFRLTAELVDSSVEVMKYFSITIDAEGYPNTNEYNDNWENYTNYMKVTLTIKSVNCQPKASFRNYFLLAGGIVCIILVILVILFYLPRGGDFVKRKCKNVLNHFDRQWTEEMVKEIKKASSNDVTHEAVQYEKGKYCLTLSEQGSYENWEMLEGMDCKLDDIPDTLRIYSANGFIYYINENSGENFVDVIDTEGGKFKSIKLLPDTSEKVKELRRFFKAISGSDRNLCIKDKGHSKQFFTIVETIIEINLGYKLAVIKHNGGYVY